MYAHECMPTNTNARTRGLLGITHTHTHRVQSVQSFKSQQADAVTKDCLFVCFSLGFLLSKG